MMQQTKDFVVLGGKLEAMVNALADGFGIGDIQEIVVAADAAKDAIKDASLVLGELKAATDTDRAELKSIVDVSFKSDVIKTVVKSAIDLSSLLSLLK